MKDSGIPVGTHIFKRIIFRSKGAAGISNFTLEPSSFKTYVLDANMVELGILAENLSGTSITVVSTAPTLAVSNVTVPTGFNIISYNIMQDLQLQKTNSTSVTITGTYELRGGATLDNGGIYWLLNDEIGEQNPESLFTESRKATASNGSFTANINLGTNGGHANSILFFIKDSVGRIGFLGMPLIIPLIIQVDQTGPTGSLAINGGAASTSLANVTLNVSGYPIEDTRQIRLATSQAGLSSASWQDITVDDNYPFTLTGDFGTKTIYAQLKDDVGNIGDAFSATIQYTQMPSVTANPVPGVYYQSKTVQLTSTDPAAPIKYTTDISNNAPGTWTTYSDPINITDDTTIKAVTVVGNTYSDPQTLAYDIQGVPTATISLASGDYRTPQTINLGPAMLPLAGNLSAASTIYYTLDGSDPTAIGNAERKLYTAPISLPSGSKTLKAVVLVDGVYGPVAEASYSLNLATYQMVQDRFNTLSKLLNLSNAQIAFIFDIANRAASLQTLDSEELSRLTTEGLFLTDTSQTAPLMQSVVNSIYMQMDTAAELNTLRGYVSNFNYVGLVGFVEDVKAALPPQFRSALVSHGLTENQMIGALFGILSIEVNWLSITDELKAAVDNVMIDNGIYDKISKETLASWGLNWDNAQEFLNGLEPEEKDELKRIIEALGAYVLPPHADKAGGTFYNPITVTLTALDPSGQILYTLNGADPKTAGTVYTAPINISTTTELKAVRRVSTGNLATPYRYSDVVTYNYTINTSVAPPTASKESGFYTAPISVTLTIPEGTNVYYTLDNSTPTTSSTKYTGQPVQITTSIRLKAVAASTSGSLTSGVASYNYNILAVPTSDLAPGIYSTTMGTNLATTTWNATIYYTTDGSDPANSPTRRQFTSGIPVVIPAGKQITLKAVTGFNDGGTMRYSGLAQWNYEALAQPLANPGPVAGMVAPQTITLSANAGADIYYTLGGSNPDPTNMAQKYTAPIVLNNSSTIKAITVKGGVSTAIKTYTYNLVVKGTVNGTVSSLDGPLAGARVNLTNTSGAILTSVLTDAAGAYQIMWVPGTYKVVVALSQGYSSTAQDVTVTAGGTSTVDLTAYLGGTVTGRITDGNNGIADISVSIGSSAGWAWATTDAQGNFRLDGLGTATDYVLYINDHRGVADNARFLGKVVDNVAVTMGQLTALGSIALVPVSSTLGSITVNVENDLQQPIANAFVMAYTDDWTGYGYGETVGGTVTLSDMPAGNYTVTVYLNDGRVNEVTGQTVTALQTKEVTVTFQAARSISGTVRNLSNDPVSGVRVYVNKGSQYSEATTDAQGAYTLENLGADSYTVNFEPTDKNYVFTTSPNAASTANGNVTGHDVTLKSAGTVSGKVTNTTGTGIANMRVTVGDWSNRTTTDGAGEFTVRGLKTGTYDVDIYDPYGQYVSYRTQVNVNIDGTAQDRNKDIGVIPLKTFNEDAQVFINVNDVVSNSVTLDTQMPVPGGNVRYQINFKNTSANLTAENAILRINVPSGSKYIGGIPGTYTTNVSSQGVITSGEITVNLGNVAPGTSRRLFVSIQLPEDLAGALVAGAKIAYTLDSGATNKVESIGMSAVDMKFITIEGPSAALPTQEVVFHGKASANADITIRAKLDGGQTEVLLGRGVQDGKWWSAKVKFTQAGTWTVWAYNTAGGKTVKSEPPITVVVNANVPVVESVTVNAGWNPEFTVDPSKRIASIAVSENYSMQFTVKFREDATKLGADMPAANTVQMTFPASETNTYNLTVTRIDDYTYRGVLNGPWSGNGERQVKVSYKAVGDAATTYTTALVEILILIDPSGYVSDAITGLALPGTKAVVQKLNENTNQWADWDAARYGQINPQLTDATGYYGWDVPEGKYRVVFSKTGYVNYTSEVVIVPPPKTDLNVGMVPTASLSSPAVVTHTPAASATTVPVDRSITVTFSKAMDASTVAGTNNITVVNGGNPIAGVISYDAQTMTATFDPTADLQNGTTYTVTVSANVKDTFNNSLPGNAVWTFTTVNAITQSTVAVPLVNYRTGTDVSITGQLFINGDPAPAGSTVTVTITPAGGVAASINATTGADGVYTVTYSTPAGVEATFTVTGSSGGSDTFNTVIVADPQADKATGSYVSTVTVALTSSAGTDIYYTLNGADPDPTDATQMYTGPITITSNKTLKAVAVKNGVSSDIVSYSYTITQPSGGGIVTPVLTTVTISGSIPSLPVGQTFDLSTLTVSGKDQNGNNISLAGKTIAWYSSNSAVASVSGTTLTAVAAGSTQVTATVDGKTSSGLSVTVTAKADTTVVDASTVDAQIAAGAAEIKVSAPAGAKQPAVDITGAVLQKLATSSKPLVAQLGDTTVKVAPGAIKASSNEAVVTISATAVPDNQAAELAKKAGTGYKVSGKIIEIKAEEVTGNLTKQATVTGELQITLPYGEGVDPELIDIYWYNPATGLWEAQRASIIDRAKKTITATVNHLSTWAVMELNKTFNDVQGHWAQAEVEYMASKNIINGFAGNVFNPEANITRAQYAAFLVRSLNLKYEASMTNSFKDVGASMQLYKEIVTAASFGLVNGYTKDEFRPNEAISREQMAVLVARALVKVAGTKAISAAQADTILAPFKDSGAISPGLRNEVALAVQQGISNGMAKDRFAPAATATRAQAAVMLRRMLDSLAK
ncbi:MAG: chitobiase/beta-hexosaminidase C-terminal domain-containing protein [Bacillota bacterium]